MILAGVDLYYFRLPFVCPLSVGSHRNQAFREGFLACLFDSGGNTGIGEIAPLPGLDIETRDECELELREFARAVNAGGVDTAWVDEWGGSPSTGFGLKSAVLALHAGSRLKGADRPGDASGNPPSEGETLEIPVNGLFVPDMDPIACQSRINALLRAGSSTIKVKIGRLPLEAETIAIRFLAERFGGRVLLRLDGNRSLSPGRYARYYEALCDLPVEYVEEPLENGDLRAAAEVGWPLAVDESLPDYWDSAAGRLAGLPDAVTHVILKPSTPAGFAAVISAFSGEASARQIPVLSSAFNTIYGTCALMLYASRVPGADRIAHGLGTGSFLKADLALDRYDVKSGRLRVPLDLLRDKGRMDFQWLKKVDP